MNRNIALALVSACMAAGPAFADDITVDPQPFVSTLTRAQVMEELNQFRRSGVNPWADDYNQLAQFRSTSNRAEVRAEYLASRGEVEAFTGEDSGSAYISRMAAMSAHPAMRTIAQGE
ncbi:hypothetical protein GCM10027034_17640 [Ramlibacter solisilvae]|uniref:DUF4148 domain-containing protein n=1 Tax=Ramlibacter tataouinensis TaxID=94132 RepID=A0A127JW06_9BURK|nr:DUF4148 domain-containing protein [Ramlibacter tataouinensis]AMO24085.1 hypothetical protein UC35_16070 [Ramlibacter tataouinensis]